MSIQTAALPFAGPDRLQRINRHTGFLLLLGAFALSIDPPDASSGVNETAVMIALLGILQLATFELLQSNASAFCAPLLVTALSALGCALAALGYISSPRLVAAGGLLSAAAYFTLLRQLQQTETRALRVSIAMICCGMALIAAMALSEWPEALMPFSGLGPVDGFTRRALRLARVAAIALPVLSLLFTALCSKAGSADRLARFGAHGIFCGAMAMAPVLFASALWCVQLKMLLVIPSLATFFGVCCGVILARRHAPLLETWGWLLIAISLAGGLVMGLYAFADPWIAVASPGAYSEEPRRLLRQAHVDAVVLGFAAIFVARDCARRRPAHMHAGAGLLLAAGSIATAALPLIASRITAPGKLPTIATMLVIGAIALGLTPERRRPEGA